LSASSTVLGWNAGDAAVQHDVYFGTNATDVANGASGALQGRQAGLSFDPGTLDFSTTYHWRVDEVDAASGVVTGEDFTFGKGRGGNVQVLRDLGALLGLRSEAIGPVTTDDAVISSSRIRQCLIEGRPDEAERLMTRPFAVQGVVQHGDKNGRLLGFPTANLDMGSYLRPRYGIYAVTGHLADGRVLKGAANLGIRPQFDPPKELLEPHFFDFDEDLYGQTIEVALRHFIRPEAKFEGWDELKRQIDADCVRARELLA
jgi:riboflavin kinase/FMN adenylyltransferase